MNAEQDHGQDEPKPESRPGRHAAPEGAAVHPLVDPARDPNPGRPDHAKPDED